MDVSVKKLNIGYTLSTWAMKEMPCSLSKISHLVGLFKTVEKERVRLEKAAKKGNNTKDLFVKIKDLNDAKGGKGKPNQGKKVSTTFSHILLVAHQLRARRASPLKRAPMMRGTATATQRNPKPRRSFLQPGPSSWTTSSSAIGWGRTCASTGNAGRSSRQIQEL